jgi:tripartite-type tricarboxylate transporter receptor subunit TctC
MFDNGKQSSRRKEMRLVRFLSGVALAGLMMAPAAAQTPEFYKGKTVQMMIGYSVGGGYDVYGRLIAKYMGNHIPGKPTVVPQNMTGAGSLKLANYLYNVAPKDGSVIGAIGRGIAFDPLLGIKGAKFDALKFTWLGSANDEVSVCVAWKTSGIHNFGDLHTKPMTVGASGGGADTDVFPKVLNSVLDTKMKVISGYPGGNDINLAMERGEVQGRCGWSWSSVVSTHSDWFQNKDMTVLVQLALEKSPDLPNVPLITDLAKTPKQKQTLRLIFARQVMGRPYLAPPGLPKDRATALQKAFMDTMKDPDFLAAAKKADLEINPVSGDKIQALLEESHSAPKDVVARAAELLAPAPGHK